MRALLAFLTLFALCASLSTGAAQARKFHLMVVSGDYDSPQGTSMRMWSDQIRKQFADARAEDRKWIRTAQENGMIYLVPSTQEMQVWVSVVRARVWPQAEDFLGKEISVVIGCNSPPMAPILFMSCRKGFPQLRQVSTACAKITNPKARQKFI